MSRQWRELRDVIRVLERLPDYLKTKRAGEHIDPTTLTLAWWLHNGTIPTLYETDLDGAAELLRADADPRKLERSMRAALAQEAREEKQRAEAAGGVDDHDDR